MDNDKSLTGQLLDDRDLITLADLCRSCTLETEMVLLMVEEGILDPFGEDPTHWRFSISSLRRVKTVTHLQRDLGVNLPGAALALELMDQIAELQHRLT